MKFTIITPTIQRESLIDCCRSVDVQSCESWEHIVWVDAEILNSGLAAKVTHKNRTFCVPGVHYNNGGNTPRYLAWNYALGEYVFYLDDDNHFMDERVLENMASALEAAGNPDWGLFPILYLGRYFFHDPPALARVDTANVIVRREFSRWPDVQIHESDWVYIQNLLATKPYKAFPDFRPIVNYRSMGSGPGGRGTA